MTSFQYSDMVDFFLSIFYRDSPSTIKNQGAPTGRNPMDQGKTGESTSNQEEARLSMPGARNAQVTGSSPVAGSNLRNHSSPQPGGFVFSGESRHSGSEPSTIIEVRAAA